MIVTIAVGIQDRPPAAPKDTLWVSDYKLVNSPSFAEAMSALSMIGFAYAGIPAYFSIISEMRDPRQHSRSLLLCQGSITSFYIAIGIVVYYYCGSYVSSPALGSAGSIMKKISYGIALPGLLVSTLLFIHVSSPCCRHIVSLPRLKRTLSSQVLELIRNHVQLPAKYIFVRVLQGSRHLTGNTLVHWMTWLSCTFGVTLVAYIIASSIPVFSDIVSLIGAVFGITMGFQPMGAMWLYDHWHSGKSHMSLKWTLGVCWCIFVISIGTFLTVGGTYGSVISIIDSYGQAGGSAAWSCADNSSS